MSDGNLGADERDELVSIATQLVGKPCWRVELSYGDELDLDLGGQLVRSKGPRRGTMCGEYQLSVLVDDWVLQDPHGRPQADGATLAAYDFDNSAASRARLAEYRSKRADTLTMLAAIVDHDVDAFEIDEAGLGLRITFDNSWQLIIPCPSSTDDDGDESMACWEMYLLDTAIPGLEQFPPLPDWPLIKVMPGGRWTITSWSGP